MNIKISEVNMQRLFLFQELTKRDFKQKYKRTILGMGWSLLSPLLQLLVMKIVFTQFFGRNSPHYTTYLLAGNVVLAFFKESTRGGMNALVSNKNIITKIRVPKYLFLLSKNVSSLINFCLTMIVFFVFAAFDGITFTPQFFLLIYPVICLIVLNVGVGMILSALFVFFKDIKYLYDIFLVLLTYLSAIFYRVSAYPLEIQRLFMLNPVYTVIRYVRMITIDGVIPSAAHHGIMALYAVLALLIGILIYKKKNQQFLYYM